MADKSCIQSLGVLWISFIFVFSCNIRRAAQAAAAQSQQKWMKQPLLEIAAMAKTMLVECGFHKTEKCGAKRHMKGMSSAGRT